MINWTEDKKLTIYNMRKAGHSYDEIGEVFGTTKANISAVISRMKKEYPDILTANPWTEGEEEEFISLRQQGYSNTEIAKLLSKKIDSVKKKASEFIKLGLVEGQVSGGQSAGFDKNKPTTVYLIQFEGFYKVGVTQQKITYRFSGAPEYKVIDSIDLDLEEALQFEKELKRAIKPMQYVAEHHWFERNGKTECFKAEKQLTALEELF
jgi:hypothetical protein